MEKTCLKMVRYFILTIIFILLSVIKVPSVFADTNTASISGVVTSPESKPLQGISMILMTTEYENIAKTTSDVNGQYSFPGLSSGSYYITFSPTSYNYNNGTNYAVKRYSNNQSNLYSEITLGDGQTISNINAQLQYAGKISGKVYDSNGQPVSGLIVQAQDEIGSFSINYTNTNGEYTISQLPAGDYKVVFDSAAYNAQYGTDYLTQWYNNQFSYSSGDQVAVLENQTTNADAHLQVATGTVMGIKAEACGNQITINWSAFSGAQSYNIYRATWNRATYTMIGSTISTSYTDSNLSLSTDYWYKVKPVTAAGEGSFSAPVSAETKSSASTDPLDNWYSRQPYGSGDDLYGITSDGRTLVAVGANGTIISSADSAIWNNRTSGTINKLNGVAYGNNTFVAVGANGTILTSIDGITWTNRISGTTNNLNGITFGNNTFVIVGYGIILTSTDGITWTCRKSGGGSLYGVGFGNNLFVAAGGNTILTSTDGINWSSSYFDSKTLTSVSYGNNSFVAVGYGGKILSSPDGYTWTDRSPDSTSYFSGVTYGNNTFAAVAYVNTIYTSTDGITWTNRTPGYTYILNGVVNVNNTFLAVGRSGMIIQSASIVSELTIITYNLTNGIVGTSYTASVSADGGTRPYTWSGIGLPAGLSINPNTGVISGTPTSAGTYTFNIKVTDSAGQSESKGFSLIVNTAVASVSLNKSSTAVIIGQTEQLTAIVIPEDATDKSVIWSVKSGTNVVTVSATGLITAIELGTAVIRATSNIDASKYAECNINVISQISTINPVTAEFDKRGQVNVAIHLESYGDTLSYINNDTDNSKLLEGTDYTINDYSMVIINKEYLAKLAVGTYTLTFYFSGGYGQSLSLKVYDTTPLQVTGGQIRFDPSGKITDFTGEPTDVIIPSTIGGIKIQSIGFDAFLYCRSLTSISLPASVTSIANSAFYGCGNLVSIVVQDGANLESIGDSAFNGCYSLTSINIPEGVKSVGNKTFEDCNKLAAISMPASMTSIGDGAFISCESLTTVCIPANVISIGNRVFDGCSSLTAINVDEGNIKFISKDGVLFNKLMTELLQCPALKSGSYIVPDGVINIGDGAFYGCDKLTGVSIPDGVISIGDDAFYYCSNLTSLKLPDSVTSLGEGAFPGDGTFSGCSNLTSINIPHRVTRIGSGMFYGCYKLSSLTLPDNLVSIGDSAFEGCSNLTNINVPNSVTSIGCSAFADCQRITSINIPDGVTSIGYRTFHLCSSLTSVSIPDSVISIGNDAFEYCHNLTEINIPDAVTSIGNKAFYGCDNLTNISISDNSRLVSIGDYAFSHCIISDIAISDGVTSINDYAFYYCSLLTNIKLPKNLISIGKGAFYGCSYCLSNISIPASVTTIGDEAFSICCSLSAAYFYGNAPTMGENVFNRTDPGFVVYYLKNKNGFTNPWCGYPTAVFEDSSQITITITPESPYCSKEATFQGSVDGVSDSEITSYEWDFGDGTSGTGAVCQHIYDRIGEYAVGLTINLKDGSCLYNYKWIGVVNPALFLYQPDRPVRSQEISFDASILSTNNSDIVSYNWFFGDGTARTGLTIPTTTHTYNDTGEYNVTLVIKLKDGSKISHSALIMVSSDFVIGRSSFNFGNNSGTDTLIGPDIKAGGQQFSLFEMPIGIDLSLCDVVKTTYDNEEKKYTVMIGDMRDEDTAKLHKKIKEIINKTGLSPSAYSEIRKLVEPRKMGAGFEYNAYVCGYVEFSNINGEPRFVDGGIMLVAEADASLTYPIPPVPGTYMKFGIKGEVSDKLVLKLAEAGQVPTMEVSGEMKFVVAPYIGIGAGVDKIANLEAGIEGELETKLIIPVISMEDSFAAKLTGYVYFEYNALIFISGEGKLKLGDVILYPPSTQARSLSEMCIDRNDFKLMPRDYLASEYSRQMMAMSINPDEKTSIVKSNVFPYGEPQLMPLDNNKQLLIWVDDDASRSSANRTSLMYSIYNGSTWSTPQYVNNDGTADFSPRAVVSGDNAYIVWQNANKLFDDSVTFELMAQAMDINYARFDGSSFIDITNLTSPDNLIFEISPMISTNSSEVSVSWIENSVNDPFGSKGSNTIIRKTMNNGTWDEAQVLDSNLPLITSIDSAYNNGSNLVAFTVDTDGNSMTKDDTEVYLISNSGKNQLTTDVVNDNEVQFVKQNDKSELYWISGSHIKHLNPDNITCVDTLTIKTDSRLMTNLHILINQNNDQVLVWEQADGFNSELYGAYYDKATSQWGDAIRLTRYNGKVRQSNGYLANDNTIKMALDSVQVLDLNDTNSGAYGSANLLVTDISRECNLSIMGPVYYDNELVSPDSIINLYVNIKNNSADAINQIQAQITDKNNTVLETQTITKTISSGATEEIEIPYTLPSTISKDDITVQVTPVGLIDIDLSDNTATTTIGLADLAVQSTSVVNGTSSKQVQVTIQNIGYDGAQNINVTLRKDSSDGEVLETKTIADLTAGGSQTLEFNLDPSLLVFDSERDNKLFYISVDTESPEGLYGNNISPIIIPPLKVIGVTLNQNNLSLQPGDVLQLQATVNPSDAINNHVLWVSDDESVATVSETGGVTALNPGKTAITVATVDGNKMASCEVTVTGSGTQSGTLSVIPAVVSENEGFNQMFSLKLSSGSFSDTITADQIILEGDLSGLSISTVNRTSPDTLTIAISGNLHRDTGIGKISVAAAGNSSGNILSVNIAVNSTQLAADLIFLSIKEVADGTGPELISSFDPTNLNISLQTASEVLAVKVIPTPAAGTTVTIYQGTNKITDGVINLNDGLNSIKVVVSEPNKTDKIYNITITCGQIEGCFIATAAFGSKFTWPVTLLRHFRDQYLLTSCWGKAFVNFYYHHSPPIAVFIAGSQPLRILVRVLLAPIIAMVYLIYHPILIPIMLVLIIVFFTCRLKINRKYG